MPALYAGFFLCVCVRICVLVSAFDAALRFTIQGNGASCNPCLCAFHLSFPFFIDFSLACLFCFFFNSCTRPQLYYYDSLSFFFSFLLVLGHSKVLFVVLDCRLQRLLQPQYYGLVPTHKRKNSSNNTGTTTTTKRVPSSTIHPGCSRGPVFLSSLAVPRVV